MIKTPTPNDLQLAADWLAEACKGEDKEICRNVSAWLNEYAMKEQRKMEKRLRKAAPEVIRSLRNLGLLPIK